MSFCWKETNCRGFGAGNHESAKKKKFIVHHKLYLLTQAAELAHRRDMGNRK
jgi:hypothetical protein